MEWKRNRTRRRWRKKNEKDQDQERKKKQGPKKTDKGAQKKGNLDLDIQGPKNKDTATTELDLGNGFEADGEESEGETNMDTDKDKKKTESKGKAKMLVPTTPEWGGWEDIREISPYNPTPSPSLPPNFFSSPPPPNQLQNRHSPQNSNVHRNTRDPESEPWTVVLRKASTQKAVFERVREKDCQVFVDLKLEKGQADVWKHKAGRDLTIKANEVINRATGMDIGGKPEEIMIWGAHRIGEGKYIFDVNSPVGANWLKADGNRDIFAKG